MTDLIEEARSLIDIIDNVFSMISPCDHEPLEFDVIDELENVINSIPLYSNWCGREYEVSTERRYPSSSEMLKMMRNNHRHIDKIALGSTLTTYREIFNELYYVRSDYDIEDVDSDILQLSILDADLFCYASEHGKSGHIISYLCDCLISRFESRYPLDKRGMKRTSSFSDIDVTTSC